MLLVHSKTKYQDLDISGKQSRISCRWPEVYGMWLIQHPQASHAQQDDEECETEDEERIVGGHGRN